MSRDEHNPYAPPAEFSEDPDARAYRGGDATSDYESERRAVLLCVVLSFVTFGLYSPIWLLLRGPFLNRLNASKELGATLPIFVLVTSIGGTFLAFTGGQELTGLRAFLSLGSAVASIMANFRVAHILRSDFARTGRFLDVSGVGTFFLGIFYLQYKINQAADLPARALTKKKRKKKARALAEAEADREEAIERHARASASERG